MTEKLKKCEYCGGTGEVFQPEFGTGITCSYCLGNGKNMKKKPTTRYHFGKDLADYLSGTKTEIEPITQPTNKRKANVRRKPK